MNYKQTIIYYPRHMSAFGDPIGDPFGGPAFGKKEMPIVAVAMAAWSVAGGVAAFAAAETIGAMVVAGAQIVGGALAVVGTITGNKTLGMIGGVLSLGATAYNIVDSGTLFGTSSGSASAASSDSAVGATTGTATGSDAAIPGGSVSGATSDVASVVPGTATPSQQLANIGGPTPDTSAVPTSGPDPSSSIPQTNLGSTPGSTPAPAAPTNVLDSTSFVATSPNTTTPSAFDTSSVSSTSPLQYNANTANSAVDSLGNTQPASKGMLGTVNGWLENNKGLAQVAGQAAVGLGQSLITSDKDKAIIAAYQQKLADDKRKALWATGKTS